MKTTPRKLGWIPSIPDIRDKKYARPLALKLASLPVSVRLPMVPMPLDQGNLGSCVSNAVANAVNFCRQRQHALNAFHPSRLFNYYVSREQKGWQDFDSGDYVRDSIKVVNSHGSLPEDEWAYDVAKFRERPPEWCYTSAERNKSVEYLRLDLPGFDSQGRILQIKTCLAEGFPVVIGFAIYSNFPWGDPNGEVMMPQAGDYTMGGHAVLIVGYDDGANRYSFLNSWGQPWGKLGRGTLPYEYLGEQGLSSDHWTIRSVI